MTLAPTRLGLRYRGLRLDGDADELHHAQNALQADTCDRGRCDPDGTAICTKHERQAQRPHQRHEGGGR